jgi:hypothetical protein
MKWMMVLAGIAGLIATDASRAVARSIGKRAWVLRSRTARTRTSKAEPRRTSTDTGLRFGFGYFLNEHLEIGGNFVRADRLQRSHCR